MTDLIQRIEAAKEPRRKGPAVIVGPHGHCLAPGHTGHVVSTPHGYAILRAERKDHE